VPHRRQAKKLAEIQRTNAWLYRAYLLKEQLRQIYRLPAKQAEKLLDGWIASARESPHRGHSSQNRQRIAPAVIVPKLIRARGWRYSIIPNLSPAATSAVGTRPKQECTSPAQQQSCSSGQLTPAGRRGPHILAHRGV